MAAIFFGSISTISDTSELQRRAFNEAFEAHGLSWSWGREEYRNLLERSGGAKRIEEYAESRGQAVDAQAVHETKSGLFQRYLEEMSGSARPGVAEVIRGAKEGGFKVGLVTTTSPENVESLLGSLSGVGVEDFDVIVDSSKVERPKPDGASYVFALGEIGEDAADCVAIEDNVEGVGAAGNAGISCVAFPNENTAGHDFGEVERTGELSFEHLRSLVSGN